MNTLLRNVLAVIAGFLLGSFVNMALVVVGPKVFPPPAGLDMTTPAGLKAAMPLLEAKHFLFPFLAHALGTFVGALVAFLTAGSRKTVFAYVIGILFLCGGIAATTMMPAPKWFIAADLILAYLPMTALAVVVGRLFTLPSNQKN
ncbi:hypothetical protein [Oleiharenicola lentus]|uniref:hypothetical protein n=1 Tax=Oleiharenicola lentus TaxID=2508720 RepID=UPI003F67FE96